MPIHDWTRVKAGIFHDFHHAWIEEMKRVLNSGLLPPDHYALAEQLAGGYGPDVLTLEVPSIAVRHVSDDHVVAVIEIVSPGNKGAPGPIRTFAEKAAALLRSGVHLLIVDLFPPGPRDPRGIHPLIWSELDACDFQPPADRPLTAAAYIGGLAQEAFVEPLAVGMTLPEMPLFLTPEWYVQMPLEQTYQSAWSAVPARWRQELEQTAF